MDYELQRKSIKNVYLRVKPPDGRVVVTAPRRMSAVAIDAFVASRRTWIEKQQARLREQAAKGIGSAADERLGDTVMLWGKTYPLRVVEGKSYALRFEGGGANEAIGANEANGANGANGAIGAGESPRVNGAGKTEAAAEVVFTVRASSTDEQRLAHFNGFLREMVVAEIQHLAPIWEERTGLHAKEWRTRFMTSRWGSCSIQARRICINVQLVHYPPECLEYVIVHELAHLAERTHGPRFQALMDTFLPDWRRRRALLKA